MESIKDNNDMLKHIIPLLSHSIIAHQNWNATILNTATSWANELISLEECIACDNQNFQNTLRILNENELEETVEYVNAKQVVPRNLMSFPFCFISLKSISCKIWIRKEKSMFCNVNDV